MANEFIIKNGFRSQGNSEVTGSLNVTGGITGSLQGTAATASYFAGTVTSASYASTASYAANGGVTKILAGANVNLSPANGLGDVTVTSFGTNLYNTATGSYGSFYDTGSVLAASATAVYSMSLSTTDISNGVFVSASNGDVTRVKFTNAGTYNLQFSSQFSNTDNSIQDIIIWVRKNGVDIPDSSGVAAAPPFKAGSNGQVIAAWNYYLSLSANDYIQMCWHVEQANVITLETIAAGTSPTHPRTPATILTATRVDTFLSNTGSFSGSFTGTLTGTASFATTSSAANITDASDVNAQFHIAFVANTGSTQLVAADRDGLYNPKFNTLTVTASYATQAISASYAPVFPYTGSAIISGSLAVLGKLTGTTNGVTVLDSGASTLYSSNTSGSVAWDNRFLQSSNSARVVRWNTQILQDTGEKNSIDWASRQLYDSTATPAIAADWRLRYLSDSNAVQSVAWGTRLLKNNVGTTILDWQNATFTGSVQGTASFATQALSASWAPGGAAGSQGNIQFNNGGTFGSAGSTDLLYDTASRSLHNGKSVGASGIYSHAQGGSTTALGDYSHAEGEGTTTGNPKGYYATMTASGVFTILSSYGDLSGLGLFDAGNLIGVDDSQYYNTHTYVNLTAASCSFDGTNTLVHVTDTTFLTSTASIGSITNFSSNAGDQYWGGYAAHAQGNSTTAQGAYSHAEGNTATANGTYSHAEGESTTANGYASHAEGSGAAYGEYSHAEGASITYGSYSHAEGESAAGWNGYLMSESISAGVIKLQPIYGDRTLEFVGGGFVLIEDGQGQITGVRNTYRYQISSSAFTSSLTQIQLYDTSVSTATEAKIIIGIYENPNPAISDVGAGQASHAEGSSTSYGVYSHAAGAETHALGWYQSTVGQYNKPVSDIGAFIVGDGVDGSNRHNLLVAASGSVTISGSLIVSPTSSGTPAYTGKDGEIVFGQTGANYKIYVWLGGAWRSGSLS